MILLLVMTPHQPENQTKRLGFLGGFALLTGLGLGPIMDAVMIIDPRYSVLTVIKLLNKSSFL